MLLKEDLAVLSEMIVLQTEAVSEKGIVGVRQVQSGSDSPKFVLSGWRKEAVTLGVFQLLTLVGM